MRVLIVTAWPPWNALDGGSLILRAHLRVLAARHEISVVSAGLPIDGAMPEDTGVPDGVALHPFGLSLSPGVDYALRRVHSLASREPAHVHWVERPALRGQIERSVDEHRPDVVYLFGWGTAQLWGAAQGVPTVHCAVDPWAGSTSNRLLPWWRRLAGAGQVAKVTAHEKRHYPRVGLVTVVAPEDAAEIARRIPDARVRVVRNGVDAGPVPRVEVEDGVVGFHGAFVVRANTIAAQALVRDVLPRVRAKSPTARVLLVGREPPAEIRGLASEEVRVMADVAQVRPWLERMAVYVAPMTVGTGLKNKVLEAMAAGRPVVATPLALQGIGPGPGVVEAPDLRAVADEVARLLDDPAERSRLGRGARGRVVEEFSWERSAAQLERAWEEAVSRDSGETETHL